MSSPKRAAFDIRLIAGMNIEKKKLMPWVFLGTRVIGPFLTKRPIPNEAAIILSKSVAKNALGPFIYYVSTCRGGRGGQKMPIFAYS